MNTIKTQPEGKDACTGTNIQLVGWLETGPFTVEVTRSLGPVNRSNRKETYVKLDTGIPDHRRAGGLTGLQRNRRSSGVDRASIIRDLPGAVSGLSAHRAQ